MLEGALAKLRPCVELKGTPLIKRRDKDQTLCFKDATLDSYSPVFPAESFAGQAHNVVAVIQILHPNVSSFPPGFAPTPLEL